MEDISLHILDIVQNSIIAGATRVTIRIIEDIDKDLLLVEIKDNGQGMDEGMVRKAMDPFFTTKVASNVGLGLPFFALAAKETGGDLTIDSGLNRGTNITARFRYSHIDRKPLGDMKATMSSLIIGNPDVDFRYEHKRDNLFYQFDTSMIHVNGLPETIRFIQEHLRGDF